ncbi:SHOCT domain-containing protein [uncultured Enterococcus sp.]|uniref:SHOCT domain-containing protein n=1 Tax=uncultured Enterococcus sp. TaxID=167972 RepID=UPI002588040D|nr:SHOCT domain-containing protein [uncultured Enterococcus sp.]
MTFKEASVLTRTPNETYEEPIILYSKKYRENRRHDASCRWLITKKGVWINNTHPKIPDEKIPMAKIADVELHIGKGLLVDYLRLQIPGNSQLLYFTNRIDAQKAYEFLTDHLAALGGQSAKSYVDEEAGKIKLLSYHYRDAWIIAEDTLTILDCKKKEKQVLQIPQITSVNLKEVAESGLWKGNGFLELYIGGGAIRETHSRRRTEPNHSLCFAKKVLLIARIIQRYLTNFPREHAILPPQPTVNPTAQVIAELRELKVLVDEGILTEEEFAFKKKQLLGL